MRITSAKINKILAISLLALKKLLQTDLYICFSTAFAAEK